MKQAGSVDNNVKWNALAQSVTTRQRFGWAQSVTKRNWNWKITCHWCHFLSVTFRPKSSKGRFLFLVLAFPFFSFYILFVSPLFLTILLARNCLSYLLSYSLIHIVMRISIVRQRLGKHIRATNAFKNRTAIGRQRSCKHASLKRENGVFREVRAEGL
jgi:hypothetical protein